MTNNLVEDFGLWHVGLCPTWLKTRPAAEAVFTINPPLPPSSCSMLLPESLKISFLLFFFLTLHLAHPVHCVVGAHHHSHLVEVKWPRLEHETHNVNVHALPPPSIVVDPSIVAPDIDLGREAMVICLVVWHSYSETNAWIDIDLHHAITVHCDTVTLF